MRGRFDQNRPASNRWVSPVGFAALMFAAWCQVLLVVSLARMPQAQAADALDCVRMCQADADDDGSPAPRHQDHSGHDCVLCVMCIGHASPAALLSLPRRCPIGSSPRSCCSTSTVHARRPFAWYSPPNPVVLPR